MTIIKKKRLTYRCRHSSGSVVERNDYFDKLRDGFVSFPDFDRIDRKSVGRERVC